MKITCYIKITIFQLLVQTLFSLEEAHFLSRHSILELMVSLMFLTLKVVKGKINYLIFFTLKNKRKGKEKN